VLQESNQNKYRTIFFVSILFIVIFAIVAFYLLYQSQQAQKWNDHRRQIDTELGEVLSGIHEMASSTRGFILTGQVESIIPYKQAYKDVKVHIARLDSLTAPYKEEVKMNDTLEMLIEKRKALLDELVAVSRMFRYTHDTTLTVKINQTIMAEDKVMDQIRIQVESMISYEQYLFSEKVDSGDNFNNQAYILIICFGVITITVSLYGFLIIQRENKQKQAAQRQLNEYYSNVEKVNTLLSEAEDIAKIGSWEWDIASGNVYWSDGLYKIYNLSPEHFSPTYDSFISIVHEDDKEKVRETISEAVNEKKSYQMEFMEGVSGQNKIVYAIGLARFDNKDNLVFYYGIIADVTQQRNAEKQLLEFNNALKKSNEELEQFAYVASHDLQEPLRKIRSFGDRLLFRYGNEEMQGKDYVMRMMDGAERMQILIQDLLTFSRVSRDAGDKGLVDMNKVVKDVMDDLQISISEAGAHIHANKLPKISSGNTLQMHQLMLNLLSNALKFRKPDEKCVINISYRQVKGNTVNIPNETIPPNDVFYEISIQDNGIGFDEKYIDKIFTIFQRLHGRNEYKGTGIGLALCKKICKNHDGFITAKSDGKNGSTFLVYLPV